MQNYSFLFVGFILYGLLSIGTSCTSDQLGERPPLEFCDTLSVSYNMQMQDIINTNCAFVGCHVAGSSAPGNYSTYAGMVPFLNEEGFERFVVDLRADPELGMPPNREDNIGPQDLTDEDFDTFRCWIEMGYPEN